MGEFSRRENSARCRDPAGRRKVFRRVSDWNFGRCCMNLQGGWRANSVGRRGDGNRRRIDSGRDAG